MKSLIPSNILNPTHLQNLSRGFGGAVGRFSLPPRHNSGDFDKPVNLNYDQDLDKIIRNNILGHGKSPQVIKSGPACKFSGKIVTFNDPWKAEVIDGEDVANNYSIVLSCGLGGGGSESSLFRSYFAISQLLEKDNIAVYSSLTDSERRPERFTKGLPFYYDQGYINLEESQNFFDQVFKEKFFDKNGKLKDPKRISDTILFGFSIGHRENVSHINYLFDRIAYAIEAENKPSILIERYSEKVALVNIGSPVNWNTKAVPKEILDQIESGKISPSEIKDNDYIKNDSFYKKNLSRTNVLNIRSVFDMGTAKPESDFNNFHCNSQLYTPQIFKYSKPNSKEYMYLLGSEKVSNIYFDYTEDSVKSNHLGHDLINYASAIFYNPTSVKHPMLSLISSAKSDISSFEMGVRPMVFDLNRQPSKEDREALDREWKIASLMRDIRGFQYNRGQQNQR